MKLSEVVIFLSKSGSTAELTFFEDTCLNFKRKQIKRKRLNTANNKNKKQPKELAKKELIVEFGAKIKKRDIMIIIKKRKIDIINLFFKFLNP